MKWLLLTLSFSLSAFAEIKLQNEDFKIAVTKCGGSFSSPESTTVSDSILKDCVNKHVDKELHETVAFWSPKHTMKVNEARYLCRGHIGKRGMHGEDSGEFEACVSQMNCIYDRGIDHIGLSPAPCVSPDEIGMREVGKVYSGETTEKGSNAGEKSKSSQSSSAQKQ